MVLALTACQGSAPASTTTISPTATTTPPTNNVDAAAIYRQNCSPCHGVNRQGGVGPNITAASLQSRGRTDQYVRETIANGRGGMPSWKDKLAAAQIEALVAFLRN